MRICFVKYLVIVLSAATTGQGFDHKKILKQNHNRVSLQHKKSSVLAFCFTSCERKLEIDVNQIPTSALSVYVKDTLY